MPIAAEQREHLARDRPGLVGGNDEYGDLAVVCGQVHRERRGFRNRRVYP